MPASSDFVQRFHAGAASGVLVVTGGGSLAASDLLTVPGASRTVLEALVPYSEPALAPFLGVVPEQACSSETTRALAMRAFQRADMLAAGAPHERFGFAITASLRTTTPKRGDHRIFVAVQTLAATREHHVTLSKGRRTRIEEEHVARDLGFDALGAALSIDAAAPLLDADEVVHRNVVPAPDAWQRLWTGAEATCAGGSAVAPRIVLPGAFNPLHDGHRRMAAFAAQRLRATTAFEICITNVDKPPLDCVDTAARLASFDDGDTVWLTRLPTFVEKSRVFRRAQFVVGVDTIVRIADEKYYAGSSAARDAAIAEITASGCRFLVFGRLRDGAFVTLSDVALPPALVALCDGVSEADFRLDVSSTHLRNEH